MIDYHINYVRKDKEYPKELISFVSLSYEWLSDLYNNFDENC
jgi:hypothetical protein